MLYLTAVSEVFMKLPHGLRNSWLVCQRRLPR